MSPFDQTHIEIVLPVHNEQNALAANVELLVDKLKTEFPFAWRVTIADNASVDETPLVAAMLAARYEQVETLRLERKGRGLALRTAWLASHADVVSYMDVDLSTNLASFLPLVAPLLSGHSEVAIGTRLAHQAHGVRFRVRSLRDGAYSAAADDRVITRKRGFPFRQPCSYRLMIEKLATSRGPRLLLLRALLAICVALTVGLTVAGTAAAEEACWRTVLNDWSDGPIDGSYPPACYRSALAHLPTDAELYSNAKADITAAMRRRALSSTSGGVNSRTNGPAKRVLARIGAKNATAVPVALIALTSAALVLIACGLCYGVARRRGGRRAARP